MSKFLNYIKLKNLINVYNNHNNNNNSILYAITHYNVNKSFKNNKISLVLKTNKIKKIIINGAAKKMFKNVFFYNLLKGPTCILFFKNIDFLKNFFSMELLNKQFIPLAFVCGSKLYSYDLILNNNNFNNINIYVIYSLLLNTLVKKLLKEKILSFFYSFFFFLKNLNEVFLLIKKKSNYGKNIFLIN